MKPELLESLDKARDTITSLDGILFRNKYTDDLSTVFVAGLLTTLIQYHHGILLLVNSGDVRAAAALARDVVDNMYVALWVNGCASSDQVNKIKTDDRFPVTYPEIFEQVDAKYKANAYFSDLKDRCGAPLYSCNRTGILKLGLWSLGSRVDLQVEQEVTRGLSAVTLCILFLASEFLVKQNRPEESKMVQELADEHEKRSASASLFFHKSA
jgi:hypothetical protein